MTDMMMILVLLLLLLLMMMILTMMMVSVRLDDAAGGQRHVGAGAGGQGPVQDHAIHDQEAADQGRGGQG
jgi:hypothetical protein